MYGRRLRSTQMCVTDEAFIRACRTRLLPPRCCVAAGSRRALLRW